jgi:hypothetical protein
MKVYIADYGAKGAHIVVADTKEQAAAIIMETSPRTPPGIIEHMAELEIIPGANHLTQGE